MLARHQKRLFDVTNSGRRRLRADLTAETTLRDFQALLAERTGVLADEQEILSGFPPRPLQVSSCSSSLQRL